MKHPSQFRIEAGQTVGIQKGHTPIPVNIENIGIPTLGWRNAGIMG
jgi:hypothetical protein